MDLKALLVEAKQKVPPVLQVLQMGDETMLDIGGTNDIIVSTQVNTVLNALQNCPGCVRFLCCDFIKVLNIFCSLLFFCSLFSHQEREDVRSVVVWVTGSQIVPSWRPCRRNRLPTLDAKTIWPTAQWISKAVYIPVLTHCHLIILYKVYYS